MRAGRGHTLSPTVTAGVWPDDITYDRMKKEKGVGFVPGGEVPPKVRTTAWDFMGQNIPKNYGMLVFAQPLSTHDAFDPSSESIHGLLSGSSHEREEPSNDDEPMSDPYMQPRGSSHQGEAPQGSSHQGEAPRGSSQRDTSAAYERWWEDHRSPPGSPEEEHGAEHDRYEPYLEAEDEVMEQATAIWEGEIEEYDEMIDRVTSSASATNPWFLYEAGIICSRQADGSVELNSSGERVTNLREWAFLLSLQRIKLRKQEIKRPDWEKLPWTGHLFYLFTRAWEIGRTKSQFKRDKDDARMRNFSENVQRSGCDWMRGQGPPNNWEKKRRNIPMNSWHETWLNYQRDLEIQEDMEWLSEVVFQFYQVHLDRMIRKNELLWGDCCKPKYHWNEVTEEYEKYLDLNMTGFDITDPTTVVTPTPKTAIPEPEKHVSFTTILMVMAIEPYQEESTRKFCHNVTYAHQKLVSLVWNRENR